MHGGFYELAVLFCGCPSNKSPTIRGLHPFPSSDPITECGFRGPASLLYLRQDYLTHNILSVVLAHELFLFLETRFATWAGEQVPKGPT